MIAVIAGIGFLLLAQVALDPLLRRMTDDPQVLAEARSFAMVVFVGAPLLWSMALLTSAYRGMGNMRFPAMLLIGGALVQIPLSGTLVLGWFGVPQLGIKGAAISVLVVAALSTLILLLGLRRDGSVLNLRWSQHTPRAALFQTILKIGLPSALSPVLTIGTLLGLNVLVGAFGVAALAGYGVASRIEFLVIPLVFGLGVAMNAMVGINLGAGQIKRAVHIGWVGSAVAATFAGVGGLVLALFPDAWASLFTDDPQTLESARGYLRYVGPFFAFQGLGLSLYWRRRTCALHLWRQPGNGVPRQRPGDAGVRAWHRRGTKTRDVGARPSIDRTRSYPCQSGRRFCINACTPSA